MEFSTHQQNRSQGITLIALRHSLYIVGGKRMAYSAEQVLESILRQVETCYPLNLPDPTGGFVVVHLKYSVRVLEGNITDFNIFFGCDATP